MDPFSGSKEEQEAAEGQAIGRAHRQGQQKKLIVTRFLARNTIESECYERTVKDKTPLFRSPVWRRAKNKFQKVAKAVAAFAKSSKAAAAVSGGSGGGATSSAAAAARLVTGLE